MAVTVEPGTEKAVVLFSRTCLSLDAPYNRAQTVWVTNERRIVVPVVEGVSETKNPGVMIYELDFGLNVVSARGRGSAAHRAKSLSESLATSNASDPRRSVHRVIDRAFAGFFSDDF